MPIFLACSCGKKLKVREELVGKRVKCPECGELVTAPVASDVPTAAIAEALLSVPPELQGLTQY